MYPANDTIAVVFGVLVIIFVLWFLPIRFGIGSRSASTTRLTGCGLQFIRWVGGSRTLCWRHCRRESSARIAVATWPSVFGFVPTAAPRSQRLQMSLLIDGYNLLYVSGILGRGSGAGSLQASRLALLNFLAESLGREESAKTTVVFDAHHAPPGLPGIVEHRGIRVRFASKHESADELIEELIQVDSAPRRLTVVSSDHRIQRAAKRRRAKAVDSDAWFAAVLRSRRQRKSSAAVTPARPPVPLLEEEVDYWIRQFGGESLLRESLHREVGRADSFEPAQERRVDRAKKTLRTKQTKQMRQPQQSKQGERVGPTKRSKQAKKTPRKRRCRTEESASHKSTSKKLQATDIENLTNPFPPGYADDLLGELD